MPRRAARKPRHRRKPARRARKTRVPRSLAPKHQMASVVETIEYQNINANLSTGFAFTLSQFARAFEMARLFKFYKAAYVTWTLEPMFNTYQSASANTAIPYVYTVMNRTQDASPLNIGDYLAQGAKPRKLTSIIKTSYRPNWCSPGLLAMLVSPAPQGPAGGVLQDVYQQGLKTEYGWLSCPNDINSGSMLQPMPINSNIGSVTNAGNNQVVNTASLALYNGHQHFIEQKNSLSPVIVCKLTARVHWVFKDPKYTIAGGTTDTYRFDASGNVVPSVIDV